MPNAEKLRPIIIATGALIVVATIFIWPKQPAGKSPPAHTYEHCLAFARHLTRQAPKYIKVLPPQLRPALRTILAQSNVELYTLSLIHI